MVENEPKTLYPAPPGITRRYQCIREMFWCIPKNLDVLEKFPDIVSGKLDLESFIPKTMATTGYVEPKSSKKRKKTTTDEANKKAKVDIIDGEAEEDKTNAEPVKNAMAWCKKLQKALSESRKDESSILPLETIQDSKSSAMDALHFLSDKGVGNNVFTQSNS